MVLTQKNQFLLVCQKVQSLFETLPKDNKTYIPIFSFEHLQFLPIHELCLSYIATILF